MAKTLSHCQGKGSLTHNTRVFVAKNVDPARIKDDVIFARQELGEAYDFLFSAAVQRYNDKQKRADRKIKTSYFEHLFNRPDPPPYVLTAPDKRKSFYEDVVQIGTMHDTGVGTADFAVAAECLTEYMRGFFERNPNFYVFDAVLHLDEQTPHLHIDYIPVGHYKQSVDTQNGIAQALKEMGYGTGKDAINRWRLAERAVLEKICIAHGIEVAAPQKSRGSLVCEKYKEYAQVSEQVEEKRHEVERLENKAECAEKLIKHREELLEHVESVIDNLDNQYQEKKAEYQKTEEALSEKNAELEKTSAALADNQAQLKASAEKVSQINDIDKIEAKKKLFGNGVTVSSDDYEKITDLARKQIAAERRDNGMVKRIETLTNENKQLTAVKERLTEQNAELRKKNSELNSVRGDMALATLRSERDNLKRKLDSIQQKLDTALEFIKGQGLWDKLKALFPAFDTARSKGQHR